jgi:hypothetical protein
MATKLAMLSPKQSNLVSEKQDSFHFPRGKVKETQNEKTKRVQYMMSHYVRHMEKKLAD